MSKFITTPERRANLVTLARFLMMEPIPAERFHMRVFATNEMVDFDEVDYSVMDPIDLHRELNKKHECGTVCCAVGSAVKAGIEPLPRETDWWEYSARTLIDDDEHWREWRWCFDDEWERMDNTPLGASKRILWLLLNGLPEDWIRQKIGEAPLCYANWTPTEADWEAAANG